MYLSIFSSNLVRRRLKGTDKRSVHTKGEDMEINKYPRMKSKNSNLNLSARISRFYWRLMSSDLSSWYVQSLSVGHRRRNSVFKSNVGQKGRWAIDVIGSPKTRPVSHHWRQRSSSAMARLSWERGKIRSFSFLHIPKWPEQQVVHDVDAPHSNVDHMLHDIACPTCTYVCRVSKSSLFRY